MNKFRSNAMPSKHLAGRRSILRAAALFGAGSWLPKVSAQSQGKPLVVYSTTHPAIQAGLQKDFTAKTGIEVRSIRLASGAMAQRFMAEQKARNFNCDIITLGNPLFFETIAGMGLLENLGGRPSIAKLSSEWRPSDFHAMTTAAPGAIGYNSTKVQAGDFSRGWQDLLDPKFKGRLIMTDPRSNENFVLFLAMLKNAYGSDFLKALGQQQLRLVPVTQQGLEQVAAGEGHVIFPCLPGNLAAYRGKNIPVQLTEIPTPTFWMPFFAGVCKYAPNKDGAYLWFDYMFSEDAQKILCADVSVSPLGNIQGALPYREVRNPDFKSSIAMSDEMFDLLQLPA